MANNDALGKVNLGGETLEGVGKSREVDDGGVGALKMEVGLGLEVIVGQRVDSDLEIGFEGRAICADVKVDTVDRGHRISLQ